MTYLDFFQILFKLFKLEAKPGLIDQCQFLIKNKVGMSVSMSIFNKK
jgi:hypothetical protein